MRDRASVHPKTITEFSEGKLEGADGRRLPKRGGASSRITALRVDERVWEVAWKLSGKRLSLIEVLGSEEVIIHNSPNWRERRS